MAVPRFLRPLEQLPGLRSPNRAVQASAALYYGILALLLAAGVFGGLVVAGIGFLWWRSLKTVYSVNLGSASGETKGLQST